MKKLIYTIVLLFIGTNLIANDTLDVLFIGNSYTHQNDLPGIIKSLANSAGDDINYQSHTPGGYTLEQHSEDSLTLDYIQNFLWDFVVLQEQSRLPSFPDLQVEEDVYPYAKTLDSLIHETRFCVRTIFYMTWGRENGDSDNCAFFPPLCTYEGMDSLLQLRYLTMAESNEALVAPVAKVWRKIRADYPNMSLYDNDGSHPSSLGSFAAALTFYTMIFQKDPYNTTYNLPNITSSDADIIRSVVQDVVYDSIKVWSEFDPFLSVDFDFTINNTTVEFENLSENATDYIWDFGDDSREAFNEHPTHVYANSHMYRVCLTASNECESIQVCKNVEIATIGIDVIPEILQPIIYPNPAHEVVYIENNEQFIQLEVIDVLGRQIKSFKNAVPKEISVSEWSSGIYFLNFLSKGDEQVLYKMIVQ